MLIFIFLSKDKLLVYNYFQIFGKKKYYCRNIEYLCKINLMMDTKDRLRSEEIRSFFESYETFKTNDIALFYSKQEPFLRHNTLNWRIYELVEKGVIERIGRGLFKAGTNNIFVSNLKTKTKNIARKIHSQYPYISFAVWDTENLKEFTQHISISNFTLIDCEKDVAESIFLFLKNFDKNVFFNPNSEIIDLYINTVSNPIIVRNLISEAPLKTLKSYSTFTLEKILVDLYCDSELFNIYQGRELSVIYENAFDKYTINLTKLLRYASRRGKREEIQEYLKQIIGNI